MKGQKEKETNREVREQINIGGEFGKDLIKICKNIYFSTA